MTARAHLDFRSQLMHGILRSDIPDPTSFYLPKPTSESDLDFPARSLL